jgi:hypothetical protein
MAEFEELRLSVVLVDSATAGLQDLNRQLIQLGGTVDKSLKPVLDAASKQMKQLAAETRESNKAIGEIRKDLEHFGNALVQIGQQAGLIGQIGAIGGLIGIIAGINSALGVFGQKMLDLREASTTAGLVPDQFMNIARQLRTMGYTSEQADAQVIKFFRNLNELTRTGTPEFERMRQLTAATDRNAVFQFAKNLQAMVNRGEGEKAIAEAAAEVQRIFNRELAKPGGRAEATRQAEAAAQVFGLDPERVQNITAFSPFGGETEWQKRIELATKFKEQMVLSDQAFKDMIFGMQTHMLPVMIELNRWAGDLGTTWGEGIGKEIRKSIEDVKTISRDIMALWNFLKGSREDVERRLNEQRDRQQGGGGWLPDWFKNLFSVTPAGAATMPGGPGAGFPGGGGGPMGNLPSLPPQQALPRVGPTPSVPGGPTAPAPSAPGGPPAPVPYSPAPPGPGGIPGVPRAPSGSSVGPGRGPGAGQSPPTGGTQAQPGGFGPMPPGGFGPPTGRFAPYGSSVGAGTGAGAGQTPSGGGGGGSSFDERFRGAPGIPGLTPGVPGDTFDERFRGAPIPGPTATDVPAGPAGGPSATLPPPGQPGAWPRTLPGGGAAPSEALPATPPPGARGEPKMRAGDSQGLHPELLDIVTEASRSLPEGYTAKIESGVGSRPGGSRSYHPGGNAADVRIYGPDGKAVGGPGGWYQDPRTFRLYEQFAQAGKKYQMEKYPNSPGFAWGGYFQNKGPGSYGFADSMHMQRGGPMSGGTWEAGATGVTRQWLEKGGGTSVGMGAGLQGGGGPIAGAPGQQGGGWPTRAPTTPWPGTGTNLAADRAKFAEELKNPDTARLLAASTAAEVGGQGRITEQAYMESVMNRASARGMSLRQTLTQSAYYPSTTINKLGRSFSEAEQGRYNALSQDVIGGSNITKYATGNASAGVGVGQLTFNPRTGEYFGIEAQKSDRAFAERMRATEGTGGAAGRPVPFLSGKDVARTEGGWTSSVGLDRSIIDAGMGREMQQVEGRGDLNVTVTDKRGVGAQEGNSELFQPKPVERMTQHEPAKEGPSKPESTPDPIDLPEVEIKGGDRGGDED